MGSPPKKTVHHQHDNPSHLERHHQQQIKTIVDELKVISGPGELLARSPTLPLPAISHLFEKDCRVDLGCSWRRTEREPGANLNGLFWKTMILHDMCLLELTIFSPIGPPRTNKYMFLIIHNNHRYQWLSPSLEIDLTLKRFKEVTAI